MDDFLNKFCVYLGHINYYMQYLLFPNKVSDKVFQYNSHLENYRYPQRGKMSPESGIALYYVF